MDEVCVLCASKFRVCEPGEYALFLVVGGSSQQLAPDTHPQKIKAELHSRPQVEPFHFVYRRVAAGRSAPAGLLPPADLLPPGLGQLAHLHQASVLSSSSLSV